MKEYKGYKYSKEGETYTVYNKEGKDWIVGFKTEEEAKKQIEDLVRQEENAQKAKTEMEKMQEEITNIQTAILEIIEEGK